MLCMWLTSEIDLFSRTRGGGFVCKFLFFFSFFFLERGGGVFFFVFRLFIENSRPFVLLEVFLFCEEGRGRKNEKKKKRGGGGDGVWVRQSCLWKRMRRRKVVSWWRLVWLVLLLFGGLHTKKSKKGRGQRADALILRSTFCVCMRCTCTYSMYMCVLVILVGIQSTYCIIEPAERNRPNVTIHILDSTGYIILM